MIPSDSDEEAPVGGYYVHQGDPVSVVRSKTLSAGKSGRRDPGSLPTTGLGIAMAARQGTRRVSDNPAASAKIIAVDNPPLQTGGSLLSRRRTAPTRRTKADDERFFGRRRTKKVAATAEAP
jgi:hypothetical protein